jgi:glucosyltransferase Lgt1/2/3
MPFTYNPHRHVKIWLSDDPNVFMNIENQLRLVRTRAINPTDEIHLVYDSSLLSSAAFSELQTFCTKHTISPIDVQKDIIPACQTKEEIDLLAIYQDDIQHLKQGGNLGAASDILRWLKPVFCLGTYSDFDVEVNTRNIAAEILVDKPLLFNVGSVPSADDEAAYVNNDAFAVVDSMEANGLIKKIQQSIYKACIHQQNNQSPYNDFLKHSFEALIKLGKWAYTLFPDDSTKILSLMHLNNQNRSAREFRQHILGLTAANDVFLKFEGHENKLHEYAEKIRLAMSKAQKSPTDDAALVEMARKNTRFVLLKNSVIHTTGSAAILINVFPQLIYKASDIDTHVAPYSFEKYKLDTMFQYKNHISIHTSTEQATKILTSETIGINNDVSWLEEGVKAQKEREQKMEKSALIIQSFFRGYQVRKQVEIDTSKDVNVSSTFKP